MNTCNGDCWWVRGDSNCRGGVSIHTRRRGHEVNGRSVRRLGSEGSDVRQQCGHPRCEDNLEASKDASSKQWRQGGRMETKNVTGSATGFLLQCVRKGEVNLVFSKSAVRGTGERSEGCAAGKGRPTTSDWEDEDGGV